MVISQKPSKKNESDLGETQVHSDDPAPVTDLEARQQQLIELLQKPLLIITLSVCLTSLISVSALILYQRWSAPKPDNTPRLGQSLRPSATQRAELWPQGAPPGSATEPRLMPPSTLQPDTETRTEGATPDAHRSPTTDRPRDTPSPPHQEAPFGSQELSTEQTSDRASPDSTLLEPSTTLEILHEIQLHKASISVWVDGELAWTRTVERPGDFRGQIKVRPGRRKIEVHVSDLSQAVEGRDILYADLEADENRRLRVQLDLEKKKLRLTWE